MHDRVTALRVAEQLDSATSRFEARLRRGLPDSREQFGVRAIGVVLILGVFELPIGICVEIRAFVGRREWTQVGNRVEVVVAEIFFAGLVITLRH